MRNTSRLNYSFLDIAAVVTKSCPTMSAFHLCLHRKRFYITFDRVNLNEVNESFLFDSTNKKNLIPQLF